jgi:hypothetical protein
VIEPKVIHSITNNVSDRSLLLLQWAGCSYLLITFINDTIKFSGAYHRGMTSCFAPEASLFLLLVFGLAALSPTGLIYCVNHDMILWFLSFLNHGA